MDEQQEKVWEFLQTLDTEQVIRLFVNYYGTQILDEEFAEYLVQEELATEEEVGLESEEDDEEDEEQAEIREEVEYLKALPKEELDTLNTLVNVFLSNIRELGSLWGNVKSKEEVQLIADKLGGELHEIGNTGKYGIDIDRVLFKVNMHTLANTYPTFLIGYGVVTVVPSDKTVEEKLVEATSIELAYNEVFGSND